MKNILRQKVLERRKAMTKETQQKKIKKIIDFLCSSKRYEKANTVFTYISMGSEVNTYPLIEQAWGDGKKVAVPIAKMKGKMYFVLISSFSELKKSHFGVMEPEKGEDEEVTPVNTDLFLVPGSVFDKKGNRYGYGGGYYDRYFQQYPNIYKIALAYSLQIMEDDLQVDEYDIPVDGIVTEDGLIGGSNDEYFN